MSLLLAAVSIAGAGQIESAEAVGSPFVGAQVVGQGVASAEAFGAASIEAGVVASGVGSAEAFGEPSSVGASIGADGVASAEAFGAVLLAASVEAAGISSQEAIDAPVVSGAIEAPGIGSMEAIGAPEAAATVAAAGFGGEAFGAPLVGSGGDGRTVDVLTQPRSFGAHSGRRYGSFAGRTESVVTHPVGRLTQARAFGAFSGRRYGSFAGRSAVTPPDIVFSGGGYRIPVRPRRREIDDEELFLLVAAALHVIDPI